jgi:tRNA(Ile2) C34 agmatinyltransferase TiaS
VRAAVECRAWKVEKVEKVERVEKVEKVEGKEPKPPPVKLGAKSAGQPGFRCV